MGVGKSTFAFTNTTITLDGGSTTINITRDNQSYSHKLSHGYGNIATLAVGTTSYTWKPTAAQLAKFFQEVPNQKTRQIDVYLDTYNGSTLVGRDVHAVTVTLSEATGKPTLSSFAINDGNATTKGWGILVYGKSTITASQSASAKHGASIVKTVYTYGGSEYTSITSLIGSLPLTTTPTNYTIGCKTVDSRGFTTTASLTKSCAKYEAPTIDSFEVIRCDSSGNETEAGTKAKAIVKGSWCHLAGKNASTLKVGYKAQTGTEYTYQTVAVTNGIVDVEQILSVTFDANTDYVFAVSLSDAFTTYTETDEGFANSQNIMYVSADGDELTFDADVINIGKKGAVINFAGGNAKIAYEKDEGASHLTFRSNKTYINFEKDEEGNEYINIGGQNGAIVIRDGDISVNSLKYDIPVVHADCDQLTDNGKCYIGNNSTNRPVNLNGWLESEKYSTDYCHQVYTTYQGATYERTMRAGTWGSWKGPLFTDFIVAQGTSGIWYYRKWASGMAECWTNVTASYANTSVLTRGLSLPFAFTSVTCCTATLNNYNENAASAMQWNCKVQYDTKNVNIAVHDKSAGFSSGTTLPVSVKLEGFWDSSDSSNISNSVGTAEVGSAVLDDGTTLTASRLNAIETSNADTDSKITVVKEAMS